MLLLSILNFILAAFLGYVLGRWSDYYLNFWIKDPNWAPDHWIYGLMLMFACYFIPQNSLQVWLFLFGAGFFISDLRDFLHLKFYGSDKKDKSQRKFWHID